MRKIIFLIIITFMYLSGYAQIMSCGNLSNGNRQKSASTSCNEFSVPTYSGYSSANTPIKYVRITIHVMLKSDGTGNFPDNQASRDYISGRLMNLLNNKYSNTQPMALSTNSPYYQDTRIQFSLANIYFWYNDIDCNISSNPITGASQMNSTLRPNYVDNQPSVQFKNNSVHVFFVTIGTATASGQASDIGDKKWVYAANPWLNYVNNTEWFSASLLAHELGHSMGLYHTWCGGDYCDDTPDNHDCWNNGTAPNSNDCLTYPPGYTCPIASNNLMDYNASESALTQCQINRIHYFLLGNEGNISDCLISGVQTNQPTLIGNSTICYSGTSENLSNIQFGELINWSVAPVIVLNSNGCGNNTLLQPLNPLNSGSTQISYNVGWGNYGNTTISKNLMIGFDNIQNVIYSSNTIVNEICTELNLTNVTINNNASVTFNTNGNGIIINGIFQAQTGSTLTINK